MNFSNVNEPGNDSPETVALENPVNNLAENNDTTNPIKLADIAITDDALGTNNISLTGADAGSFEVDGNELFLSAGTSLDFETQDSYNVTVVVDDPEVGNSPDITTDFTLNVTDVPIRELDDPLFRFHNSNKPGTYLFAGHEESENIYDNYPEFMDEGETFNVSSEAGDDLMRFYRFRHRDNGGYLFAGEEESVSVREDYPIFEEEGMAFYTYGVDAGIGVDIFRFRNTLHHGSYIFVGEAEKNSIEANYPNFVLEGVAFETAV